MSNLLFLSLVLVGVVALMVHWGFWGVAAWAFCLMLCLLAGFVVVER